MGDFTDVALVDIVVDIDVVILFIGDGDGDSLGAYIFCVVDVRRRAASPRPADNVSSLLFPGIQLRYVSAMCSRTDATIDSWALPLMSIRSCNISKVC